MASFARPVTRVPVRPVDEQGLLDRLRMTAIGVVCFASFVPALVLLILTLLAVVLGPLGVGLVLAHVAVPLTSALTTGHRQLSSGLLAEPITAGYLPTDGLGLLRRPWLWLRDPHRWRDVAFLAFSATGGAVLSAVPALLLITPLVHTVLAVVLSDWPIWLVLAAVVCLPLWWALTPALVRTRARIEQSILGLSRAELAERVEQVEQTRAETLDHSAAEIRRIERDLHDGAQARMASVGMNVGLAEQLLRTDPEAAETLLREARESTIGALSDLRSVVRGIHPPALAETGLDGAVRALVVALPLPVTVSLDVPDLPHPVQSAAYFAVSECLANTVKHADATHAWLRARHDGAVLRIEVGDDGRGGARLDGSGIAGIARRLAAFDGTLTLNSPTGGPTTVLLEVPCPTT